MPDDLQTFVDDLAKKTVERRSDASEASMIRHLRNRYAGNSYAFFSHVRDSTGYGGSRTADAIVMGLWPSRGLELEGFEIKISRTDWQKELKSPEKADVICKYCDRWWVVVSDEKIVHPGELPPTWGLLTLRKDKLIVKVQAPKLTPVTMDRGFIASLLRKASEGMIDKAEIKAELTGQYKEGFERGKSSVVIGYEKRELEMLKKSVEDFEAASGISINAWNGPKMGQLVRAIHENGPDRTIRTVKNYARELKQLLGGAEEALKRIEEESKGLPTR